jgi:chromosome segregation ATPase
MNKNNYSISSNEVDKIKKYIEQTNDTTSNLRDANDINIVLQKYEDDLREHSNEVRNLKKKIKTRDDRIEELEYDLNDANDTIYELEDKVSKLEETLNYFKELWKKFIEFLQDKFFSSNKYDDVINELYNEEIIDDDEIDIIQNNSKNKDDFDRDL